ncbi:glycosyl transferase, group 1 [Rhodopirellula maiorica SM1]|uniref:Glycosyl transferase, group 1 n=1 Tax=Rhodopirellula maiorica SM1 TaxID=1265738 RepID=M5S896_9BACT|nr:glycosyl transferase, group 1 [Rhodopirellula maiorica SM1]
MAEGVILGEYGIDECAKRTAIATRECAEISVGFCVSREIEQYAKTTLRLENAIYVPNGGDCGKFKDWMTSRADNRSHVGVNVLWMGSGKFPWEGHRQILSIASELCRRVPTIQFTFIGGGKELVTESNPQIRHLGVVPHDELSRHLAAADICLCIYDVSAFGEFGFYNSPLKLYEYMAAGRAIIASNVGEIARTLVDQVDGILVGPDRSEIEDAIMRLLNDPDLRERLGKNARKKAEQFYNWDRVAHQTTTELERICSQ